MWGEKRDLGGETLWTFKGDSNFLTIYGRCTTSGILAPIQGVLKKGPK